MTSDARHFCEAIRLHDDTPALIRAIRPDDRERLAAAFLALEPASVYLRYFSFKSELTPADLDRLCMPDFHERVVLVVVTGAGGVDETIIGSGGYVVRVEPDGTRIAEVAFVVNEHFQDHGLAGRLLAVLAGIARADGIAQFEAEVLGRNAPMLQVFAHSGLPVHKGQERDGVVSLTLSLAVPGADASR
jgi:RimJ/RimL family protein N-acetyltransferase